MQPLGAVDSKRIKLLAQGIMKLIAGGLLKGVVCQQAVVGCTIEALINDVDLVWGKVTVPEVGLCHLPCEAPHIVVLVPANGPRHNVDIICEGAEALQV